MEITACSGRGGVSGHSGAHRGTARWAEHRLFVWLLAVPVALGKFSTTASAHGDAGRGGPPVAFAVVVGLPIVVGLVVGVAAIAVQRRTHRTQTGHHSTRVFGLLFLFLGGVFAIEVAARSPWLALAGSAVGGIGAMAILTHRGVSQRGDGRYTELSCGAISLHRVLEGFAIGTLYSAGAAVGVLGAVAIAGHTVLETGAIGGRYRSYHRESLAAIGLVQLGYAGGAIAGVGLAVTVPVTAQSALLALAGGVLLAVGTNETRNAGRYRGTTARAPETCRESCSARER